MDSHIDNRVYNEGKRPERDKYSIHLNTLVNKWVGAQREIVKNKEMKIRNPHIWSNESQIIVQLKDKRRISGDVKVKVSEDITKDGIINTSCGST